MWIAGVGTSPKDQIEHGLTRHWDGQRWRSFPTEDPPESSATWLFDVSGDASDDVWAVGSYQLAPTETRTVAEHWDGTAWHLVPSPNLGPRGFYQFGSVSTVSPTCAFAVMNFLDPPGSARPARSGTPPRPGWLMKWNGVKWVKVYLPAPRKGRYFMYGVSADRCNDGWAVGVIDHVAEGLRSVAAHWDGTGWTEVQTPPTAWAYLNAVSTSSPSSAWAVGSLFTGANATVLIRNWDGTAWQETPVPAVMGELLSVDSVAANDAWAVGKSQGNALAMHWDGATWTRVSFPSGIAVLTDVSGTGPNDVWTVGADTAGAPVVAHWDGTAWTLK